VKIGALREAERMLAERQAELSKVTSDLDTKAVAADSQRVELVALRAQVEALKDRVNNHERDASEIGERLDRERKAATTATTDLNEERSKGEKLADRVMELERALVAQTTETEVLGRRIQELETRLADQVRMLSEREIEGTQMRDRMVAAQKIESDLRAELAAAATRGRAAADSISKEKALIEDQLNQSKAERSKLQHEIATMKREAEQTWAAERVENALLRERINDIAAEIARLTVALEGENSPVEAMLSGDASGSTVSRAVNGERKLASANDGKGSLADRIRALQLKASRVPAHS
jgi:chromosome segregation ATPase